MRRRAVRAVSGAWLLVLALWAPAEWASAQVVQGTTRSATNLASVRGVVTAMGGEVLLPGVDVAIVPVSAPTVRDADTQRTVTDERARFQFVGLAPGAYRLSASLSGFADATRDLVVEAGRETAVTIDLQIAGVSETVEVAPQVGLEVGATLGSAGLVDVTQLQTALVGDVSIEAILPLVPGVIRGPAGVSIKGGRPTQSSLELGGLDLVDASTGESEFRLASNAVSSLEVLPSPYAVEFGRFSAGLTVVQPRQGGEAWRVMLGNINPSFTTKRRNALQIVGVERFTPRLWFGGPLVPKRVFVAQSLQYRYSSADVRSRPQDDRTLSQGASSFTRVDANLAPGRVLTATVGVYPESVRHATLGTFDPPEATASTRWSLVDASVALGISRAPGGMVESALHVKRHGVRTYGDGLAPMELTAASRGGHFFNDQDRVTWSVQWRESLSGVRQQFAGTHFYKVGLDAVHAAFAGTTESRPVLIRDVNGTLVREIRFAGPADANVSATDVAIFVQDRWQPVSRLLVDAGIRWDRDGVLRTATYSPRLGARVGLDTRERMTLSLGVGRFTERTPLTLGALGWLEPRTVTDYTAGPGGSISSDGRLWVPRFGPRGLETPRALTWHAEYHWRMTQRLSVRADVLTRDTRREYVVAPEIEDGAGWLTIDSRGHSRYREAAFGARYDAGSVFSADVSYTRSTVRADLNSYAAFVGTIRTPVIRGNTFARTDMDVPNRVVARVRGERGRWRAATVFEYRDGFPYSAFDTREDYVGEANGAGRLRTLASLNVTVERRVGFRKVRPWVGLQLLNALGRFHPLDVQQHVQSPEYGRFYNSDPRRLRITLRF